MKKYILTFNEIKKNQKNIVGGKAYNLSQLWKKRFSVPKGFVVSTLSFDSFLKANSFNILHRSLNLNLSLKDNLFVAQDLREKILNQSLSGSIEKQINHALKHLEFDSLAVRSSATIEDGRQHSFAGQFESYLNVKKVDVLENIIKCFSSLFSPRVIIYAYRKKISLNKAKMAVVIHQMINPDIAGNLFTINFLNKNKKQVLIETVKGSGDKVTDGTGDSSRLIIDKKNFLLIKKNKERFFVNSNIIFQLCKISLDIERVFKMPQEIEWAVTDNRIYIIQSRPISFYRQNAY